MNTMQPRELFYSVLICPKCGAAYEQSTAEPEQCNACGHTRFTLGDVPCLFPSGIDHKLIWQFQAGVMDQTATLGLQQINESLNRYDLSDLTRERLIDIYKSCELSKVNVMALLKHYGIDPLLDEEIKQIDIGDLSEYYDLILRDWAWDTVENPGIENQTALRRVVSQIEKLSLSPKKILVIGSGGGRLSWDLHAHLKPELTVALDSHPVMLSISDWLIRQHQPIALGEFKIFPQIGNTCSQAYTLNPPKDPENLRERWFGLGGNVWHAPLKNESFDLILTPWLVDVTGGDLRDLISVIHGLLREGGQWINTGPLLFTKHIPVQVKYNAPEIRELLNLAGFEISADDVQVSPHLISPLEARGRTEQIWTFTATKTKNPDVVSVPGVNHAWLVMHHLPVPLSNYSTAEQHPLIHTILALVDGQRSINDICAELANRIPEGISVKDAVVTLFGQSLAETDNQQP